MGRHKKPYEQLRQKVLFEHLEKYPSISSRSMARILIRDYPQFFENLDHARDVVRIYRGSRGAASRKTTSIKKYFKPENLIKDESI